MSSLFQIYLWLGQNFLFPCSLGNIVAMSLINQHPFGGRAWFSPFNMGWLEGYVLEGRSDYGRFSFPQSAFEVTPGRRVV